MATVPAYWVVVGSYLAQGGLAVLLALVLGGFFRIYRRGYLLAWAVSWLALALHVMGGAAGLLAIAAGQGPTSAVRLASSLVFLVGGYLQVAAVLVGVLEIWRGTAPTRGCRWGTYIGAVVVAVTVALLPASSPAWRLFFRLGLRGLFAGVVFALAGWLVWRAMARRGERERPRFGAAMVGGSFALYGLAQLHLFGFQLAAVGNGGANPQPWGVLLGLVEVLVQAAMGLGMVVWLYEEEREQVLNATGQIDRLAYRDPLTGLPNRRLFLDRLSHALVAAQRRQGGGVAVVCLDLDGFQAVNDSFGNLVADEVLRTMADRLRRLAGEGETVARLGGDEFAVLLPEVAVEAVAAEAGRLRDGLAEPLVVANQELVVGAAVGVSVWPPGGSDALTLLEHANTAMHRAKQGSRHQVAVYSPDMNVRAAEQLTLEAELRQALANDRLVVAYQPVVVAATGEIVAVEALVRWEHPVRGVVRPGAFVRLVEGTPLGDAIDDVVLRTACRQVLAWQQEGLGGLRVAVNVSAGRFQSPTLVADIERVLAETGIAPSSLELEITETAAMQDPEASLEVLSRLGALGVRLAIDDFGTGHSSLSYLRTLPIDTVKLDRSFVIDLERDADDAAIVGALVDLAHGLGLEVVAEGVETPGQLAALVGLGCDRAQGYLLARPLSAAEAAQLIGERRRLLPSTGPRRGRRAS
jgi:diguanylate cyclase (GGDEF)-like protein